MRMIGWIFSAALVLTTSAAFAYDAQGSGKISNGNCTCKSHCDQFAKAGQCKSDCQQKFAGCNKGSAR